MEKKKCWGKSWFVVEGRRPRFVNLVSVKKFNAWAWTTVLKESVYFNVLTSSPRRIREKLLNIGVSKNKNIIINTSNQ